MFNKLRDKFNKYNDANQLSELLSKNEISKNEYYLLTDQIYIKYYSKNFDTNSVIENLNKFWGSDESFESIINKPNQNEISESTVSVSFSRRRAPNTSDVEMRFSKKVSTKSWSFKLSDEFTKSISKIDKKIQGRILEAIGKITQSPMSIVGDTIKPLTSNLSGYWRYRIGDYRLIYKPIEETYEILLITFVARGSVY